MHLKIISEFDDKVYFNVVYIINICSVKEKCFIDRFRLNWGKNTKMTNLLISG